MSPWTAESFKKKHNQSLSPDKAAHAARIANEILSETGDEAKAIKVANYQVKKGLRREGTSKKAQQIHAENEQL